MANIQQKLMGLRKLLPWSSALTRIRHFRPFLKQETEVFGVPFLNPVGIAGADPRGMYFNQIADYGFGLVLTGPFSAREGRGTLKSAIAEIVKKKPRTRIAAILSNTAHIDEDMIEKDYLTSFSMFYDFVDFFLVEMFSSNPDSIEEIVDELVALRLCYEAYKPIVIKFPKDILDEDADLVVAHARLSGVDGIAAYGAAQVGRLVTMTQGRLPILGIASSTDRMEGCRIMDNGASLVIYESSSPRAARKAAKVLLKKRANSKKSS